MYTFARQVLASNPSLSETLRCRFPVVLVDEMQDAQKFQDELIRLIFAGEGCLLQRFGDPDQSIYDGLGGEEPNDTYNNAVLQPIAESHRFVPDVAFHIRGLSYRKLQITTAHPAIHNDPKNTIILFDDANRTRVLHRYAEIVAAVGGCSIVNAVGGVAENTGAGADALSIKNYWPDFDRTKAATAFVPATFCQAARFSALCAQGDAYSRYAVLIHGVLEVLRRADVRLETRSGRRVPINRVNLAQYLRLHATEHKFRTCIAHLMMAKFPAEGLWAKIIEVLCQSLVVDKDAAIFGDYLAYDAAPLPQQPAAHDGGTIFRAENGMPIRVSTIHAVKGETHDATLVLETKYRTLFDVQEMLPYILDHNRAAPVFDPARPTTHDSIRASFMKRTYVAGSRPRHLLCLAIGRQRVTDNQRRQIAEQRWQVIDL
jgi:hypothetical protein